MYKKNKVCIQLGTSCNFRHCLAVLENIPMDKGELLYILVHFSLALTTHITHHQYYKSSFLKSQKLYIVTRPLYLILRHNTNRYPIHTNPQYVNTSESQKVPAGNSTLTFIRKLQAQTSNFSRAAITSRPKEIGAKGPRHWMERVLQEGHLERKTHGKTQLDSQPRATSQGRSQGT